MTGGGWVTWARRWLGIVEGLGELPVTGLAVSKDSVDVYLDTNKSVIYWVRLTWSGDCVFVDVEPRVLKRWEDVTALWGEYSKLVDLVGSVTRVCEQAGGAEARLELPWSDGRG